jgi:hypothetical protein
MAIEKHEQLRQRTKQFALRIIRLSRHLPVGREADVIGRQVLRSGTVLEEARQLSAIFTASRRTAKA